MLEFKHFENHELTLKFKKSSDIRQVISILNQTGIVYEVSNLSDYDFVRYEEKEKENE